VRVLVTGAAGFIGAATSLRLLERGDAVFGYDNINDYYDPALKHARLARLLPHANFSFEKAALEDRSTLDSVFAEFAPHRVVHLAAQAGVRYSIENPRALHRQQSGRLREHPRSLSYAPCRASRVRVVQFGLWRQPQIAVFGRRSRRPSALAVCGHEESQRADGAHLQPSVSTADDRAAVFHRVRAVGPAGHGAIPVHPQDPGRGTDRGLQPRPSFARLHLHRRYRRGRGARA
jgi:hypothetical protein